MSRFRTLKPKKTQNLNKNRKNLKPENLKTFSKKPTFFQAWTQVAMHRCLPPLLVVIYLFYLCLRLLLICILFVGQLKCMMMMMMMIIIIFLINFYVYTLGCKNPEG